MAALGWGAVRCGVVGCGGLGLGLGCAGAKVGVGWGGCCMVRSLVIVQAQLAEHQRARLVESMKELSNPEKQRLRRSAPRFGLFSGLHRHPPLLRI